jgi:hypothetical protein
MWHETTVLFVPPELVTAVLLDHLAETVECMVRLEGSATHIVWTHEDRERGGQSAAMSARIQPHSHGAVLEVEGVLLD